MQRDATGPDALMPSFWRQTRPYNSMSNILGLLHYIIFEWAAIARRGDTRAGGVPMHYANRAEAQLE